MEKEKKMQDVRVEVECENESKAVGHIEVPTTGDKKGYLLSSRIVWSRFRPVTEAYRLGRKMQGDGQVFRCPKCGGMLCLRGETPASAVRSNDEAEREAARQRAVDLAMVKGNVDRHIVAHGIKPDLVPITLGKTRIDAE